MCPKTTLIQTSWHARHLCIASRLRFLSYGLVKCGEEVIIYVYIHHDTSSNLMTAMDIECGGFTFISNFDSGNLARVELVSKKQNVNHSPGKNSPAEEVPDFEFNIWTKPDCAGTEFENSNRTWFYFGIKGGTPFVLVKLNIVNLNRQSKMYSQGMAPVFRVVPGRSNWDRIKEKPTYAVEDDVFILSFKYRTLENIRATTYFAFTYPFTYVDLQNMLNSIDTRFRNPPGEFRIPNCLDDIYYHRECVCYSLEGRQVDLITISSFHSMSSERETRLKNLFPMSDVPRPFCFHGKKVVFVSARVHPGETPSSFVLNGLLNLLLTRDDPVAILLRKIYVFKLIPMLNPDGVSQGHYRTDTRGVNLNRMYLNPVFELHPSVYAARALIRYYHHGHEIEEEFAVDSVIPNTDCKSVNKHLLSVSELETLKHDGAVTISSLKSLSPERQDDIRNNREHLLQLSDTGRISSIENQVSGLSLDEKQNESSQCSATSTNNRSEPAPQNSNISMMVQEKRDLFSTIHANILNAVGNADAISNHINNTIPALSEGLPEKRLLLRSISSVVEVSTVPLYTCKVDDRITDSSVLNSVISVDGCLSNTLPSVCEKESSADHSIGSSSGKAIADMNTEEDFKCLKYEGEDLKNVSSQNFDPNHKKSPEGLPNKVDSKKITITPEDSGLYLYVDLHGHASKKGIFMYGNYFEDTEDSIECMLLPKIMSLNSQNFHFTACNFTEKIMYLRDRRDGMSREGSGRVAVWKTTGLVRSYTLECNYNTGRLVNILPPSLKEIKNSQAVALLVPPKYTPQVFEEVGRALGVSILDLTGSNPWSRIPNSEFHTLLGIRDWLRINCLPEQNYVHKVMQDQKQVKRQPCNAQVGGMAGMSNGVPPHLMHPSSSKSRLTSNKRDTNFARTRRLAPLVTKSSESKVGPVKVSSSSHVGILLHTGLKSVKGSIENANEDSERKENLSSFQVGSCSQSSSCVKVTKVFPEPKENIGPCSSQRCSGTSSKLKSVQSSSSVVLKQVLAVRSKCATIDALAGSSKMTKGSITSGRMQRITALDSMTLSKKGNQTSLPTDIRIAKFRRSGIMRPSQGVSQGECICSEAHSAKRMSEYTGEKGSSVNGVRLIHTKSCMSVDRTRYTKDEQKIMSDETIVKQGPKRLKISAFKIEDTSANSLLSEVPHKNEVLVKNVKLKDICLVKIGKGKKLPKKYDGNLKSVSLSNNSESPALNQNDDIFWDSSQHPQNVFLCSSHKNSAKVRGKPTRKKPLPQSNNAKPVTPVTRASISDSQGMGSGSKVKYSTKSEKQGKGWVPHLSPIRTQQKRKSKDSVRKRGKVSSRSLVTSVSRNRASSSESNQSVQLEKKRKKFKSKFL